MARPSIVTALFRCTTAFSPSGIDSHHLGTDLALWEKRILNSRAALRAAPHARRSLKPLRRPNRQPRQRRQTPLRQPSALLLQRPLWPGLRLNHALLLQPMRLRPDAPLAARAALAGATGARATSTRSRSLSVLTLSQSAAAMTVPRETRLMTGLSRRGSC